MRMQSVRRMRRLQFNVYRAPLRISSARFLELTNALFFLTLHVWAAYPTRPRTTQIQRVYEKIQDLVIGLCKGVGHLIATHFISILSEIGLLSPWLQLYASFDRSSRVFRWFADRFSLPTTKTSARQTMITIQAGMENVASIRLSESVIENLACKIFQRADGSNENKRDVHYTGAPLILRSMENAHLSVFVNRETVALERENLIDKWPFGGRMCSMIEITKQMGLPTSLPGNRMLTTGNVPREARDAVNHSIISFPINNWFS